MAVAADGEGGQGCCMEAEETKGTDTHAADAAAMTRKEKRKAMKKMKRKQARREAAVRKREEEEARWNDPEEQERLRELDRQEAERMERDRREFEERERLFFEALELKKKREEEEEEEEERQRRIAEQNQRNNQVENDNPIELNEDEWEYVEEGPAEIIWQGNEIIVKKKKVRVPKKDVEHAGKKEDPDRPISNPLAPQFEAFEDYKSAQEILESVAQQVPKFGTEQDKAHCPFHLKTGACRFGTRCSRVHFYPDKSCTLLVKNMYSGPGLSWEQDEGLEYTDEEIERSFEDFYEDVHTEFLKFGEIVNFKVCNNGSSHLRGNVYVHYKSLESAVLAYHSINGRYFAGKQITCEFVNITRWKVAICGEYMKSRLKVCSRGSACNFIHCFQNPGGDYEWADWDKPPPRYWVKSMAALFGYTNEYDNQFGEESPRHRRSSSGRVRSDACSNHTSRSRPKEVVKVWGKSHDSEDDGGVTGRRTRERSDSRKKEYDQVHKERINSRVDDHHKNRGYHTDSDGDSMDGFRENGGYSACGRTYRKRKRDAELLKIVKNRDSKSNSDIDRDSDHHDKRKNPWSEHCSKTSPSPIEGKRERSTKHATRSHGYDSDTKDVDMHRQHRHIKKRKSNDGPELSNSDTYGGIGDDEHGKLKRNSSFTRREADLSEKDIKQKIRRDGEDNKHRRRSSRRQSKEPNYSKHDSHGDMSPGDKSRTRRRSRHCDDDDAQHEYKRSRSVDDDKGNREDSLDVNHQEVDQGEPEGMEEEQAYRLSALEKLEEKRRLKNADVASTSERLEASANNVDGLAFGYDRELSASGDVATASSRKRLRI